MGGLAVSAIGCQVIVSDRKPGHVTLQEILRASAKEGGFRRESSLWSVARGWWRAGSGARAIFRSVVELRRDRDVPQNGEGRCATYAPRRRHRAFTGAPRRWQAAARGGHSDRGRRQALASDSDRHRAELPRCLAV